jgi:hypothetical protein
MEISMTRILACALALGLTGLTVSPSSAGERKHIDQRYQDERYVPASDDILEWFFGGPRYYDRQMGTTAAGRCAYHRIGPDANAANDINDHYCGK